MRTPCLDCPGYATREGRCDACRRRWNAARNSRPSRRIYKGSWAAVSRAAREAQPWCSLCYARTNLTLDHTTGMVVCRGCHRSEANGGVFRAVAQ